MTDSRWYAGASIPPKAMVRSPPQMAEWVPQFLIIMHLKYCADRYDMTFMSFDNHFELFETKVLFLMYSLLEAK